MLSHRFHVRAIRSNGCCRLECQRDVHFHKYLCIYNFFQLRINPQRERERERERRELREKLRIHQGCLLQILRELLIFLIYSLRTARRKIWNVIFFFFFFVHNVFHVYAVMPFEILNNIYHIVYMLSVV
jgi:hypothetical protein